MESATIPLTLLAAASVFVIATVTVGREARRLDAVAPRTVYLLDEAVDFVGDRLPRETQARLTPGELEQLLVFHLQWLHAQGLQPDGVVDRRQDIVEPVVITEDELTAYLLGEAERTGVDVVDDVDAVNVVEEHLVYLDAIGAVGPRAPLDDALG